MKNFLNELANSEKFAGWVFIFPALLGTIIFIIIPVFCSFGLSFTKWDLLNPIKFVGFENYRLLFQEPLFFKILLNTIVFAISTSLFGVIFPLILACILNSKIRGSEFYKTAYFLPFITPMIVIGIVWQWIFDPNIGILNQVLQLHINWLYDTHFAMPALIIVSVWKLIGYNMIIFLSSLSSISQSMFEAAKIDGLGSFRIFLRIVLPQTIPAFIAQFIFAFVGGYNNYMGPLLYLSDNPQNYTLQLVVTELRTFYNQPGQVCASCLIALIPLIIVYIIFQRFFIEGISVGGGRE